MKSHSDWYGLSTIYHFSNRFSGNYKTIKVRFSTEAKFHLDSGGGGPESNLKLIPYLIQSTLYILNQTKQYQTYKDLIDNSKFDIVQATAVQGMHLARAFLQCSCTYMILRSVIYGDGMSVGLRSREMVRNKIQIVGANDFDESRERIFTESKIIVQ